MRTLDELTLLDKNIKLEGKIMDLKSEIAFLKGKIEVYERFLSERGSIRGGEE